MSPPLLAFLRWVSSEKKKKKEKIGERRSSNGFFATSLRLFRRLKPRGRERERDHVSLIIRNNYTTWLENIRASEGTWIALTVGLRSAARLLVQLQLRQSGAASCRGMQFRGRTSTRVLDWVDGTRQRGHADRRGKAVEKGESLC